MAIKAELYVHNVQCNMEMMTIPMKLVMLFVRRKLFICMNCMKYSVQLEANCIAVTFKRTIFFQKPESFVILCILRQLYKRLSHSKDFYVATILCLSPKIIQIYFLVFI